MTAAEDAALRVTVLDALTAAAEAEKEKERVRAAVVFKEAVSGMRAAAGGAIQVDIMLPDGRAIGRLSVKAGAKETVTDATGLHEWAAERNPEALESCVLDEAGRDKRVLDLLFKNCPDLFSVRLMPDALGDPRALALIGAEFPELVSSRVRPGALKAYVKEAGKVAENAPKGWLFDPATGERLHLVTETQEKPTGAFAFVGTETQQRRAAVMAALAAGDPVVRSIAFGAVAALGPAEDGAAS